MIKKIFNRITLKNIILPLAAGLIRLSASYTQAAVTLEKEVKITDIGLYFDGSKVASNASNSGPGQYDYYFGNTINAKGDSLKVYKDYIFTTWYKGGKYNRHVMLTRYNTVTGTSKTIEFPHTHTGYLNQWWIGESHNNIAVAISPKDGSIHMLYDMHAYGADKPSDGSLSDDYFRYSYSKDNAATVSDANFNISQFKKNADGGYKHLTMTGTEDYEQFSGLTYPQFFLTDEGDLLSYMRKGGNNNGGYKFNKYIPGSNKWSSYTQFNVLDARSHGMDYNWGVYGNMKYVDGKMRVGFQRRLSNNNDKYKYQNGFYYAYSDAQDGKTQWKNHKGESFSLPLADADIIKVSEPGNLISDTAANSVYIVGGFDWTVTENGDVHIIGAVRNTANTQSKKVHTYRKAGDTNFTTTTDFSGADTLYTSGDNIYIIGLNSSGRPFVETAKGGTNNFSKIYEATSGKKFTHGRVQIANGKVYYYLQENVSGDKRPLYVQIIDLDIDSTGPEGFTFATNERGTVNVTGTMDIAYGANTQFYYLRSQTSDVACTNDVFGDPLSGVAKKCYTKAVSTSGNTFVHLKKSNKTGFALDGGNGAAQYQNVKLGASNTSNVNQQWQEISRGADYYSYKKRGTQFCLDAAWGGANNQNVRLVACDHTNQNQHFKKISRGGTKFQLNKRNSQDFAVDGGNGGTAGQNVKLWQAQTSTTGNQVWTFTNVN